MELEKSPLITSDNNCGKCFLDIKYWGRQFTDADKQNLSLIANMKISELRLDDCPSLLVFPRDFNVYGDNVGESRIFLLHEEKLITGNIMGFVGVNGTQLTIKSRFAKNACEDYFLHYMLQKIFSINVFDLRHHSNTESIFDFFLYLFPYYLKRALAQGIFKEYQRAGYNDANVRGSIDVCQHIKQNTPFRGKISYWTREYKYDNHITQLIRHTIEYIRQHPLGKNVLNGDTDTQSAVSQIVCETPTYDRKKRAMIINQNLRPLKHPYFLEYSGLQNICLQILRYEGLKYGQEKDKIYGLLFDGAWLWEEYLNSIIKEDFLHYRNNKGEGVYLLKNIETDSRKQRIVPDFISRKQPFIVADAKYIPLNKQDEYFSDQEKVLSIYYKTIAYMYRWNSKLGFLIYPYDGDGMKLDEFQIIETDGHIVKLGMPIPQETDGFASFCLNIQSIERKLREYFILRKS